ncbi:MAG: ROK family protein [Chloroflexi bacterium]|nr:ROK family protein [Chloroflexota bacterium]
MDNSFIIAIDIGGTSFRVALVDSRMKIIARNVEPTRAREGASNAVGRLIETIKKTASGIPFKKVNGIAVATAGPIDPTHGVILSPPSLPTWRNVPLKARLQQAFPGVPVFVEHDADMAAVGEHRFGAGKGYGRLIYLTVSTGIGGGVILNGELLRGSKVSATELGHIVIDPDGPPCNCGGKGHVEAMASGTAIARMASERISQGRQTGLLERCGGDSSKLTAQMVTEAARAGDNLAKEVMHEAGTNLGMAVVSLIHIFDPDVVIIGGGVSNAGELLLAPIREVIAERSMRDFRNRTRIVCSELGDNSGILGVAAFAFGKLGIGYSLAATATDGQ